MRQLILGFFALAVIAAPASAQQPPSPAATATIPPAAGRSAAPTIPPAASQPAAPTIPPAASQTAETPASASAPAPAPAPPPAATAATQPAPPVRVGRVSYLSGPLAFHSKDETAWSAASVNYPVATGGAFWTDAKARAELRIGAQTVALDGNTELDIARLDQQVMQLAMPSGRIGLQLRHVAKDNSVEIDVARGGIWLQTGVYDITAGGPTQPTRIMVFEGSARFVGGTLDVAVKAGEAAVISGSETLTVAMEKAAPDAFTQWCRSRSYDEQRLAAPYYVSRRMTGYETLDEYGSWRAVPEYGQVWYPNSVPSGWVPYRYGSWSWIEPWGWNWIGAEPWGFAPYHYGRWAYLDGAWGWVPGSFVANPVYAPALVAYFADPASIVAARVAGALTGWFPLGPGEAYWPSYTNDARYIQAINAGAVANPAGLVDRAGAAAAAANRAAATVVTQRAFASGRSAAQAALPISGSAARQAQAAAGAAAAHGVGAPGAPLHGGGHAGFAAGSAVPGHPGAAAFRGGRAMSHFAGATPHAYRGGMAFHGGYRGFAGGGGHGYRGAAAFHGGGMAYHGGHGGFPGGGFRGGRHGGVAFGGGPHGGGMAIHGGSGGGGPHGAGMMFHGGGGGGHGGGGGGGHGGGGGGGGHGGGGGGHGGKGH